MKNLFFLLMFLCSLSPVAGAQPQDPAPAQVAPARPCAALTFRTSNRQRIRVFIDRKLMNPRPDVFVKTMGIEPGPHFVTLEIAARGVVNRQSSRILLSDGQETIFEIEHAGWRNYRIVEVGSFALPPDQRCGGSAPVASAPPTAPPATPAPPAEQWPDEPLPDDTSPEAALPPEELPDDSMDVPVDDEVPLCEKTLTDQALASLRDEIEQADADERKLDIAILAVRKAAVRATDVWDLLPLFAEEETRLSFAKFAYHYTCDPQHYQVVNQGFASEASVEALNQYLEELPTPE
ncbi:protein of unknown function [Catalinimonas alkaloidigena]|uniref:DUF4476 domain-containing protein n=1 Tax=Catalinimonas alkaloidigena TaxID=1075417 RepID=A0A1G9EA96_9BACT|nr:DUF4476 domain-containing protein [Catalinimonas alkaloidigena]SDK73008.1 protein of unknown function [Catalinimonas alkaloidigena]